MTHLLAFHIGFAFKLHPQHGDFPQLKATWIPASRHLGDVLLLEIDEARWGWKIWRGGREGGEGVGVGGRVSSVAFTYFFILTQKL